MAKTRTVCVMRPLVSAHDDDWLVYDFEREHEVRFEPSGWVRECMGGRLKAYFKATWSLDEGWQFRKILKQNFYW